MNVADVTSGSQTATKDTGNTKQKQQAALGKDQFLTLLITQLKNQDPLSPMDNSKFTAQMAQFSSLEQLFNVNDNLSGLKGLTSSLNNTQAMSLIGKDVEARGNTVNVENGKATDLSFELPKTGFSVEINISDSKGNIVNTISRDRLEKGLSTIEWDGKDRNGVAVSPGDYSFTVQATGADGAGVEAGTFMKGRVTAISVKNGVTSLNVGNRAVLLSDITKILEPKQALGKK